MTTLSFAEFSETILALRDTNTATVRDINTMTKRVIMEIQGTVGQLSKIKEKQRLGAFSPSYGA